MVDSFRDQERARAVRWKATTSTLPEDARRPAPYESRHAGPHAYEFCLPVEYALLNLLPEVRQRALDLMAELGVPWHAHTPAGPSNHLLDSQVQCVNALTQMIDEPDRIIEAFGPTLDIADVLQIEPGRFLTFEYIGVDDWLGEAKNGRHTRGSLCTSVDAAFLYRTRDGATELALVEWKYTEAYPRREVTETGAPRDVTRRKRYESLLLDPAGPIDGGRLPFEAWLQEPFYQLMRQQLLAWLEEANRAHDCDRVRVVHVKPASNLAYEQSLFDDHRALGATVSEVWKVVLRRPDRFVALDSAVFLDPAVTSAEYVARYGPTADS